MKRFFKNVAISEDQAGFLILLDQKPLKNAVNQQNFILKSKLLADEIAKEWENTKDEFDYKDLPLTSFVMGANALDGSSKGEIITKMLTFVTVDALLFVVPNPETLKLLQERKWGEVIDFINKKGTDFCQTTGLNSQELSLKTQNFLKKTFKKMDFLELACIQKIAGGCQSVLLALAVYFGHLSGEKVFELASLEENFQNELWGRDYEAEKAAILRKNDILLAEKVLFLSREEKNG